MKPINKKAFNQGVDDVLTLRQIRELISLKKPGTLFVLLILVFLVAFMIG